MKIENIVAVGVFSLIILSILSLLFLTVLDKADKRMCKIQCVETCNGQANCLLSCGDLCR